MRCSLPDERKRKHSKPVTGHCGGRALIQRTHHRKAVQMCNPYRLNVSQTMSTSLFVRRKVMGAPARVGIPRSCPVCGVFARSIILQHRTCSFTLPNPKKNYVKVTLKRPCRRRNGCGSAGLSKFSDNEDLVSPTSATKRSISEHTSELFLAGGESQFPAKNRKQVGWLLATPHVRIDDGMPSKTRGRISRTWY
jgi:hypothetical protein